jgi:hypothetical protein
MPTDSGTPVQCPGCDYRTRLFDTDGVSPICPECGVDALMTPGEATEVRFERLPESQQETIIYGDFEDVVDPSEAGVDTERLVRQWQNMGDVRIASGGSARSSGRTWGFDSESLKRQQVSPEAVSLELDREKLENAVEEHLERALDEAVKSKAKRNYEYGEGLWTEDGDDDD